MKLSIKTYVIIFLLTMSIAYATVPNDLPHSLRIWNASGEFLDKDGVNVTLEIYDAVAGGTRLYAQTNLTNINNGTIPIIMDDLNLTFDKQYFINVTIDNHSLPYRAKYGAVPYAMRANFSYNANNTDYFNDSLASDYVLKEWLPILGYYMDDVNISSLGYIKNDTDAQITYLNVTGTNMGLANILITNESPNGLWNGTVNIIPGNGSKEPNNLLFAVYGTGKTDGLMPHFWIQNGGGTQASGVSRSFMIVNEVKGQQNTTNITGCDDYMDYAGETLKIDCNTTTTGADLLVGDDMQIVGDVWIKDTGGEWHFMTREHTIRDDLFKNTLESAVNVSLNGTTFTINETDGQPLIVNIDENSTITSKISDKFTVTTGTNISPTFNHIYYTDIDNPALATSATAQDDVPDVAQILYGGTYSYGGIAGSAKAEDFVRGVYHRFYEDGAIYISGFNINASPTEINISTGTMKIMLDKYSIETNVSTSLEFQQILHDGSFYINHTLDGFEQYASGEAISNNKYFNVVCGIVHNLDDDLGISGARLMCIVQDKPVTEYISAVSAEADEYDSTNFFPSNSFLKKIYIPVARVVMQRTGSETNTIQTLSNGNTYFDIRGTVTASSGNPPTPSITDHGNLEGLTDNDHPQYVEETELGQYLNGTNIYSMIDENVTKLRSNVDDNVTAVRTDIDNNVTAIHALGYYVDLANFTGTLTSGKWCTYDGAEIDCNVEPVVDTHNTSTDITNAVNAGGYNDTLDLDRYFTAFGYYNSPENFTVGIKNETEAYLTNLTIGTTVMGAYKLTVEGGGNTAVNLSDTLFVNASTPSVEIFGNLTIGNRSKAGGTIYYNGSHIVFT